MLLFLALMALIWFAGGMVGWSWNMRWGLMALVWVFVLLVNLTLPDLHLLREALGREPEFWLLLAGGVALWLLYRQGLRWLQGRADVLRGAKETVQQNPENPLSEAELHRYARHIVLREIGGLGQVRLKQARVLVIGAGGLGSPALMYLAAAGVGTIGIVDDDAVDSSNMQRQVIHSEPDVTRPKVSSAGERMQAINPNVQVKAYHLHLSETDAKVLIADYDVVLDGTDNFETRYLVNKACVALGKSLISGALSQWEGQLSVFDSANGSPCYECVFPEPPAAGLAPTCAEAGVLGPLPGVIGSIMAVEAIKVITQAGAALRGEMLIYDALYGESRKIKLKPRVDCPVCGPVCGKVESLL